MTHFEIWKNEKNCDSLLTEHVFKGDPDAEGGEGGETVGEPLHGGPGDLTT